MQLTLPKGVMVQYFYMHRETVTYLFMHSVVVLYLYMHSAMMQCL